MKLELRRKDNTMKRIFIVVAFASMISLIATMIMSLDAIMSYTNFLSSSVTLDSSDRRPADERKSATRDRKQQLTAHTASQYAEDEDSIADQVESGADEEEEAEGPLAFKHADEEGSDFVQAKDASSATKLGPRYVDDPAYKQWIFNNDMKALQRRYSISDEDRDECIQEYLSEEEERNERLKDELAKFDTIHDRLRDDIHRLALISSCATSRKFVVYKAPHFTGGRQQFQHYFGRLGWDGVTEMHVRNRSAFEEVPSDTVIMVASCLHPIPFPAIHQRAQLVSLSPYELANALKVPFYRSIRKLFDSAECDYRTFHPESFLIERPEHCQELLRVLKEEPPESSTIWFFKSSQDSFGDGVKVRTTDATLRDLHECSPMPRRLFIQRGVPQIMKYQGRASQGRAYLLVSSYDPATVWFFMGYFNIAAAPSDEGGNSTTAGSPVAKKAAHVTNTRTNQKSARLLFHQFMEGKTRLQMQIVKRHIKEAALTAFLALRPKLGTNKGSYSMFGFDYVIQDDLNVKVFETNCNCELFINPERHGVERTTISTNLVKGMMDIVLASKLNPQGFRAVLENYIGSNGEKTMRSDAESLRMDDAEHPIRQSWELLYTEAVDPPYSIMDFKESCLRVEKEQM